MSPPKSKKAAKKAGKAAKTAAKAKGARKSPRKARTAPKAPKAARKASPRPAAKPAAASVARPGPGGGHAHCAATDPFGDECQNLPRRPSKYCVIHSYLDR